jgi:hypothetical protein
MLLTIDLEKYPAFLELQNPTQTVLSILDTQHSIFQRQRSTIPTTHLTEMLEKVQSTSKQSGAEIQSNVNAMKLTGERLNHTAVEMKSTSDIVRSNMSELRSASELMRSSLTEFSTIQSTLKQLPLLLAKSQTKGTIGEVCVAEFLKETVGNSDFIIEDTSTTSRSGDVRVSRKEFECVIDSKFYKNAVPKKEVEKLKRDMAECKLRCGILVSLTSGVSGYKSVDMDVYTDDNDKLCCMLILGQAKENPERITVGLKVLELVWECFLKKTTTSDVSLSIREKTVGILGNILDSAEDLRDLVRQYERHKKSVTESLTNFHEELVKTIERHSVRIQEKLNMFTHHECTR